jgi:hypothetical protein
MRVRLIAASSLLSVEAKDNGAGAVLAAALGDPAPRVRKAVLELLESLGADGTDFRDSLKERLGLEEEAELHDALTALPQRHARRVPAGPRRSLIKAEAGKQAGRQGGSHPRGCLGAPGGAI